MADETPPADPPAPPPKPAGPQPLWMAAGGPAPVGKGKALLFGSLLIVIVFGVLVGILLLPSPPVAAYLVSLPLPLYDDPALPPVAFAEQDTKRLLAAFGENAENAYTAAELDPFRGKLKAIADGRLRADWGDDDRRKLEKGRPFVFHVVGHAAVAGDKVYVLPIRADGNDPQTWLPLDEILKAMEACPTPKKLLLLDLGHRRTNAFLGPLHDEATAKLHDYLAKNRGTLPCPVLVSCSPGEESLTIPAAGASAFAFYVAEGLAGAADGYGSPGPDTKVKVRELAEFVKLRTARWARQNLDLPQVTKLFEPTTFTDFDLMLDVPAPVAADPDPLKNPFAKIGTADGWAQLAALTPEQARRAAPQLAQWASSAIRAQQVYLATGNETRTADAVKQANDWWAEVRKAIEPPPALGYRSLAAVPLPTPSGSPPVDAVAAVRGKLTLYARAALPEAGTKADEKDVAARRTDFEQAAAGLPGPAVARIVWDWLFAEYPQAKANVVEFAAKVAATALKGSPDLFVEAVALDRAAKLDAAPFDKLPGREVVMKYLRTEAAASAALVRGSAGFEWVAPLVAAAADTKFEAEELLFAADTRAKMEAADGKLAGALAKFDDTRERLEAQAAARAAVEDAARVLTGTAWAVAEYDWPPLSSEWLPLKAAAVRLADATYRKPDVDWTAGELAALTKATTEAAAPILKRFDAAAVKALLDRAPAARPADMRTYRAVLETALLTGPDRAKVWDAADARGELLHTATRTDFDLDENKNRTVTKPPTLPVPVPNGRDRRAEVAIGLLELAGHPDAGKWRAKLKAVTSAESAAGWQELTAGLRAAWGQDALGKRVKDLAGKGEWATLDRFARGWPVGAWQTNPDKPAVVDWRVAPARRRDADETAYRAWLAAHYRKYATALTGDRNAVAAFQKAAQLADR